MCDSKGKHGEISRQNTQLKGVVSVRFAGQDFII